MNKIQPIKNLNLIGIRPILSNIKKPAKTSSDITKISTATSSGIILSTFLQDYNKTVEKDNYYQFKTNPNTNTPFKPDVFQSAAGMNLYLGNDVLVTAPTGTGKTAIAQYIITKNLKEGGKTFYTTPLKALSNEKFLDFTKTYGEENVGLITGDTKINTEAPIIVMTTEVYRNMAASGKFNYSLDNKKGIPSGVKTVIFDELQYLGDKDRGGVWEQSIIFTPKNIQILSLSATIENNEEINNWIASTKRREGKSVSPDKNYLPVSKNIKETVLINVPSKNRHVPLNFEIETASADIKIPRGATKSEKKNAKKEGSRIAQSIYAKPRDDVFKKLTQKLNKEGKLPAIYFIFSKKECKHMLKYLSTEGEILTNSSEQSEIDQIVQRYKENGVYLGESLNIEALKKGYAIHNSGLLPSQKTLVEELFQKKLVKVILATETLSAGINMPAKTTVISSPRKPASTSDGGVDNKRSLTANEFHQMAGRAGRRGIDTVGYCYSLSCNNEQQKFYQELINSPSNHLDSNLNMDFSFIANYLDEFSDDEELRYMFLEKSLYAYKNRSKIDDLVDDFNKKKDLLLKEGFLDNKYKPTIKGSLLKLINGYEQIPIINLVVNKGLADLSPIQIAGIVGGLSNIKYINKGDFPQKPFSFESNDEKMNETAKKVFEEIKLYEHNTDNLHPNTELSLNSNSIKHLYQWANLNQNGNNSHQNWKNLYSGELKTSIKDEGTLFKEIAMTIDLLKQLSEISEQGYLLTNDKFYDDLNKKIQVALELIQQDPISEE